MLLASPEAVETSERLRTDSGGDVEPVECASRRVRKRGRFPVDEIPEQYAWMLDAICRGAAPTEFFPSDGLGVEAAQRVCAMCPVKAECLEYALEHRIEHGVWGGASERERRRILRRRRDLMPAPPS